jgi:hypothetical protein
MNDITQEICLKYGYNPDTMNISPFLFELFAAERERCAKLLEVDSVKLGGGLFRLNHLEKCITKYFAEAIRNLKGTP